VVSPYVPVDRGDSGFRTIRVTFPLRGTGAPVVPLLLATSSDRSPILEWIETPLALPPNPWVVYSSPSQIFQPLRFVGFVSSYLRPSDRSFSTRRTICGSIVCFADPVSPLCGRIAQRLRRNEKLFTIGCVDAGMLWLLVVKGRSSKRFLLGAAGMSRIAVQCLKVR
jgi:hypothetical protein